MGIDLWSYTIAFEADSSYTYTGLTSVCKVVILNFVSIFYMQLSLSVKWKENQIDTNFIGQRYSMFVLLITFMCHHIFCLSIYPAKTSMMGFSSCEIVELSLDMRHHCTLVSTVSSCRI